MLNGWGKRDHSVAGGKHPFHFTGATLSEGQKTKHAPKRPMKRNPSPGSPPAPRILERPGREAYLIVSGTEPMGEEDIRVKQSAVGRVCYPRWLRPPAARQAPPAAKRPQPLTAPASQSHGSYNNLQFCKSVKPGSRKDDQGGGPERKDWIFRVAIGKYWNVTLHTESEERLRPGQGKTGFRRSVRLLSRLGQRQNTREQQYQTEGTMAQTFSLGRRKPDASSARHAGLGHRRYHLECFT
ncbi:hypothetical protein BDK51DRAFT_47131 [Blyttiomyces helicus]|uniref:Uncharacterized protein n=1 Tax=Blyttiomyces helicus TaxID=388810 RepID=A0A4V1IPJ8_9FUNG|nr:hypothetical protein BDK51DRAFT_47131 [Blyttiomyces helicus]|eukprot:RKO83307.1 hypothetical protein BDK51DRAFT_47131 [Blyttiomyces helicus]